MHRESVLFLIIGLLVGALLMGVVYGASGRGWMMGSGWGMMGDHSDNEVQSGYMMQRLFNLTGDSFDQQYLAAMILHHQGAIDMATAAKSNAKHQEIKDIAQAIINQQTKEIDQMRAWQSQWNYPTLPYAMMH